MARSTTSQTWLQVLQTIEELLGRGEANKARPLMKAFGAAKPPRPLTAKFANLARRLGQPELAVRILNPIVRPPPRSLLKANEVELCEYAAGLTSVGAATEALGILSGMDPVRTPQALLYHAIALFTRWEFSAAIPFLRQYVASDRLDPYQLCVGRLNLVAAYVNEGTNPETESTLDALLQDTKRLGFPRLYGNCLELSAQYAAYRGQWEKAEGFAGQAKKRLSGTGGFDLLYANKWHAVCRLARTGKAEWLTKVRQQAVEMKHWETVRDCDLYRGALLGDRKLLTQIYFATPYESYRQRLFAQIGFPLEIPEELSWDFGRKGKPRATLSVATGLRCDQKEPLELPPVLHALLASLASDLYRPRPLATLHASLYPGEYFFPHSSPVRVHQVLLRLRKWFQRQAIPLMVNGERGTYMLEATGPVRLVLSKSPILADKGQFALRRLANEFQNASFTANGVQKALRISRRSAQRLLHEAIQTGSIERQGAGAGTHYLIRPDEGKKPSSKERQMQSKLQARSGK